MNYEKILKGNLAKNIIEKEQLNRLQSVEIFYMIKFQIDYLFNSFLKQLDSCCKIVDKPHCNKVFDTDKQFKKILSILSTQIETLYQKIQSTQKQHIFENWTLDLKQKAELLDKLNKIDFQQKTQESENIISIVTNPESKQNLKKNRRNKSIFNCFHSH